MNLDPKKTTFIIDGSSFLYRAYYGVRPLHTTKGVPVQAVYSFCRMIQKLIATFKCEYLCIVWDSKGKTTRHEMYEAYKATRQAPPSDIFDQKKLILDFADFIGIKQVAQQGIEADDIMYSIAVERAKEGDQAILITSDKDMGQAISERIFLFDPFKDKVMQEADFKAKMGFPVEKLPFYFALLGDTSDNIPGVKGIGDKTATDLVNQFASLEDLYANTDRIMKERTRALLLENKDNAFLSYRLFLLQYAPTGLGKEDFAFDANNWAKALPLFKELEFKSLIKEIEVKNVAAAQGIQLSVAQKMVDYEFVAITSEDQLNSLVHLLKQKKIFAIDTETDGLDSLTCTCVGLSFCVAEGTAYYIPIGHNTGEIQLPKEKIFAALKPILEDENYKKIFHHADFDVKVLFGQGINVRGIVFDTLLAANLVSKDWQRIGLKYLSEYYFQEPMLSYQEVVKNNKYKDFSYVPLELATRYAASDAHQTFRLKPILERQLKEEKLDTLYYSIELPLLSILLKIEIEGIYCDAQVLADLNVKVSDEIRSIEQQITGLVGPAYANVNFNSPKQVEQLLFVDLKLPPQKKSAKGSYSTDAEVLEILAEMHPVASLISKWRELSKLKSTYIEALPTYINPHTRRIHTTFSQTIVATGRLSSSEPNLQNIPTDSQGYGIEIRRAFKPRPGEILLSADYSQIELRILAYLSQDANLLAAFQAGTDIHQETAARLFDVPLDKVTHEQRQIGKRINFSILYGLTAYGLSSDLKISFKDAKHYIEKYAAQYPGVFAWMERIIIETKHKGYVETYNKRRRYVPAIYEQNKTLYEEARRVAINTVPQGTAAEIVKQGMINVDRALREANLGACMLLQIHDELLLSVPANEIEKTEQLVKETLESIVSWNIPLTVNICRGNNWKEVTK